MVSGRFWLGSGRFWLGSGGFGSFLAGFESFRVGSDGFGWVRVVSGFINNVRDVGLRVLQCPCLRHFLIEFFRSL